MKTEEKVPYLKTIFYVAMADDRVDASEMSYFDQLAGIYGLSEQELAEIKDSVSSRTESIEKITSGLTERETKLTLLYELLALCYVDNNYSLVEKQGMKQICTLLSIEQEKLTELEGLMQENLHLQGKINKALER